MTKSEVILAAVENGATDEELAVLDATPESEFKTEVEKVEEIKEAPTQKDVAVTEENTASNGEEGSTDTQKAQEDILEQRLKQRKIDNDAYDGFDEVIPYETSEEGGRIYYGEEEVGYDYDRSKGIRFKKDTYGEYLDNLAYKIIAPFVNTTVESIESGQEGEYTDEMLDIIERGSTGDMTIEEATKTIEIMQRQSEKAPSKEILKWSKTMEEESNPVYGFFKATAQNPIAAYEAIISSVAGQVKAMKSGELVAAATTVGAGTAAVGSIAGPIGTIASFIRGFMSTMGGGIETASKFGDLIMKEFADEENPDGRIPTEQELIAFVQDEEKFNSFRNKALLKGATIAAVDNFGGGIVSKSVAKTAKTGRKVAAAAKGLAGETVVGGGGEALSSVVIGEEINATDVGLEILGQGGQATVDIGSALITPGSFKVNGEKASLKQVNKILETATTEELAKIDIEVKNNAALDAEVKNKQNDAFLETQVNERVEDPADRKEMVDLEKKRVKAEADTKKKGIQAVPGAIETLESIEIQMNEIVGKYTAIDGRTKDVKARKKAAADVRKTVRENNLKNTIEFLQKNKEYAGKDVVIADDNASAQVAHDKAIEEYNAKNPDNKIKAEDVSGSDGFIVGDVIVINKDIAGKTGAINVGAHELLHGIMGKHMKTLDDAGKVELGKSFMDVLTKDQDTAVRKRLKENYNLEGDNVFASEEIFTSFSDAITKGEITFDKGVFGKLKEVIERIFKGKGYNKEFENGKAVYDFLKDYQKSVAIGGKISARAQKLASGGTTATSTDKSMSTPLEAINKLIPKNIKTKKDYDAFVQDRRAFPAIFNATMGDGVISNYVKSKSIGGEYQGAIESVQNRLTNFDPEATRADGTTVGPEGFGEFIFANTRFGKLDSKKKLFEAGEKAKKTTTIDTKEAKELEDTSTATEVEDKSKARNLRDFDIEVEDGLVNAEIEAEVEALLEKNPDDIEVQMEKLILGDIRKSLDGIIGKIAKDKKTGKRGPTAEYEAFIRNEYLEVVQSLGMETIRTAYRPWFESKKIRTEKYKGISSKTGKVTNYVKDVFENKTNKREYIRWFLEGNERNMTERRTALIRRIARRKAKIATDNYIEANSKNLDKIAEAKLRKVSRAIENTQVEQKSFDSIKYSKNKMLPTRLSQEFSAIFYRGNNGKPLVQKGTIWTGYVNPYTNEPQSFVDKGRIWEQAFANYFMKNGIEGLKVLSEIASEVDGMADFVFEYNGKVENHELKASITAFMGSISISNLKGGKIEFATDTHNNLLEQVDTKKFMEGYKKRIDFVNKGIEKLNKKIKDPSKQHALIDYDVTSGKPQNIPYELYMDKKGFGNKMFYQLKADQAVIENHYKSKKDKNGIGVRSLSFVGTKTGNMSFGLDSESILNLPRLDADVDVNFTFRNGGSKIVNGNKVISLSLGVQFKISKLNNKAENSVDITIKEDLQKALGINFSKSIEGKKLSNAINFSRSTNNPTKGITVLDFDDTLATSKSSVLFTAPDGTTGKLTAEEFAKQGADLLAEGYVYDFSEFNKVVKGKKAPLFEKALKLQGKFGPENMFILTARPMESATSIFEFIKANGLNIPLKNITGLANSTAEAKALWMVDKVSEGYNDFYFADDALQNVQAVDNILEQFDVKRKVQQARIKFSKSMDENFNDILENVTGIESEKRFSVIKGRKRGESKGKFRVFIPPSHEDFVGLLYNFMGKGKEGNKHRDFFEQALVRPLNRANREYDTARQSIATDYKALNKQFPEVKEILTKKTPDGDFTNEDAVRVYLWNKYGYKIPGLSPTDQTKLVELVGQDAGLKAYAETLNVISKQDAYVNPTEGWNAGDIRMDLDDATGRVGREQYFAEFNENADVIFSQENLNKIEAGYGKGVVVALQDILYRIKTGRNRPSGSNEQVNRFMNFLNGSVGTVMFFNMRSALLQQMSIVNYINFADNNIFAAAKAFANQKQYWKDFAFIFNSDMLKQRRGGIQTDVNGAELAASLRKSKNPSRVLISKLLELGFLPTQIGDNIAIATGGASYYRNRINKYIKDGMSAKEAEAAAFTDFQDITQSTQQSARPDMVSMQQASVLGKVILNFQNVTSQFNRLGKKAFQDIYNRRITKPNSTQMQSDISNAARITYYFAVQNAIFYTLQTALFAMMFDDDEEDNNKLFLKKKERLINGSIDSVLRGSGVIGAIVSTLKNTAIAFARQRDVNYNPDESAVVVEALNLSPVIGIKARQIVNAEKTLNYNKKVIDEMSTFDIDNPQWSAVTNYTQALTNLPLNRLYNKTQNVRQALNNDHSAWERSLMFLGWSQYNLDLKNQKMEDIKADVKVKAKVKSKEKADFKKEEKKQAKEKVIVDQVKKEKQQQKEGKLKDPKCSGVKSDGSRCGISVSKAGDKCTIHETVEQNKTGKKSQCKKIKKGGKRCGMQTSNKSGFCYYHD